MPGWWSSRGTDAHAATPLEREAYAVIDKPSFERYRQLDLPLRVLYEGPRLVVVSRH